MTRFRKKAGVIAVASVLALVWLAFVARANIGAALPEVEHVAVQQWIDLGQATYGEGQQTCPGYRFKVESARVLSVSSFVSEHGVSAQDARDMGVAPTGDPQVLVVRIVVENAGDSQEGGFSPIEMKALGSSPSKVLSFDSVLFTLAHPELGGRSGFSVYPHTDVAVDVPLSLDKNVGYFETYDKSYRQEIASGAYSLLAAEYPHRILIDVTTE